MPTTTERLTLLRATPLFADLDEDHLTLLSNHLGTRSFERGELIFTQGSLGTSLYLIVRGSVRIYTVSETGQEIAVSIFRAGDFFGELALLDGQPRSASAVAMEPTHTFTLHRAAFVYTLHTCPPIAIAVLEALAARLRRSTAQTEQLVSRPAAQRVVQQLLELAARHGSTPGPQIDLHLTQDDLASLSGTTRETVNRVLASLRDQGVVQIERARIRVLDLSKLEQALE